MRCTIEHNLRTSLVTLHTDFSHATFSDTASGRESLFRVLRAIAEMEAQPSPIDRAVAAYDLQEILRALSPLPMERGSVWKASGCGVMRQVRRFTERGRRVAPTLEEIGL